MKVLSAPSDSPRHGPAAGAEAVEDDTGTCISNRSVVVGRGTAELEAVGAGVVDGRHRREERAVHVPLLEVHPVRAGRRAAELRRVAPPAAGAGTGATAVHVHHGAASRVAAAHRGQVLGNGDVVVHQRRHVVVVAVAVVVLLDGAVVRGRVIRQRGGGVGVEGLEEVSVAGGEVRGEVRRDGGAGGQVRVGEVGAGAGAAEGACGAVVGNGGLLGGVEGAQPVPLFGRRVADLRRVPAPRPAPHAQVPRRVGVGRLLLLAALTGRR
jgi:hypothetical protein